MPPDARAPGRPASGVPASGAAASDSPAADAAEALRPASEAELAELVAAAAGPLRVIGGGTRGMAPAAGRTLTTAALEGVVLYEPAALTLVVRAGTAVAEVERLLAAEGQCLPFEPMDHRGLLGTRGTPTMGGVAAANVSGPRRIQAGAARDAMLGVRFVDGRGRVIANGGRVMKNVTGYDLVKLVAGSRAGLGILTEIAFKVLPAPEAQAMLRLAGLDDARAVAAMAAALASPWEVSGAAHLPAGRDGGAVTLLRLEGFAGAVASRAGRLTAALAGFGRAEVVADPARVAATWAAVRDVAAFHGREGDVWRLSVRPSAAAALVARAEAAGTLYDWGGGLVWLLMPEGTDLRARLGPFPGHATLVRAAAATRARLPTLHPEAPAVAALAAGLRARFDPRAILGGGGV